MHRRHHRHGHGHSHEDDFVAPSAVYRHSPPMTENHASTVASHGHYQNLVSTAMDEDAAARERRRKSTSAFRSEASPDRKSRSRSRR